MRAKRYQLLTLVLLVAVFLGIRMERQAILDWTKLRNYSPPAAITSLATETTMTDKGRHLFYVNRPIITNGSDFTSHCPVGTEKTIVLGCYMGNDRGIYVYKVDDARLDGVQQVTAAHEMLHAAYSRLSSKERSRVNAMLKDYYAHGLKDARVQQTVDAYKETEPNDLINEMHSIFATEVGTLPAGLETYYKQYFTDRVKVAGLAARYQGEFTQRQNQVDAYDAQLKEMKAQIDANNTELKKQNITLSVQAARMQDESNRGDISQYNADVVTYNAAADIYNALLATTKNLINQYNDIVEKRNAVVFEEQQLSRELSASSLPSQ